MYFVPLVSFGGKPLDLSFFHILFCTSKRSAAEFLEPSPLPGGSFALGALYLAVLVVSLCTARSTLTLCLPRGLPTLWLLPGTETCPALFPPRSTSCGTFRCSDLEHTHLVFLLWKQDLTELLTSASVLLIPDKVKVVETRWPSLCPWANSTKHSHASSSGEWFHKAYKHFKSFCTSISA